MSATEFFESALPRSGYMCAVGINAGRVEHRFVSGIAALLEAAHEFNDAGWDSYFACHTFTDRQRLQAMAHKSRSFYLDIDCGEDKAAAGKGYVTKDAALSALDSFCDTRELVKPFVIDSGRGLHVYWLLDDDVSRDKWTPVARALKRAVIEGGLLIDPAVPADSARILRVPGTKNFKDKENPKDVFVLRTSTVVTFDYMREVFKEFEKAEAPKVKREMDATSKAIMGGCEYKFAKIARLSLKDVGCAQIKHAMVNAATLEEPLWQAALSIAVRCTDGDKAIHKLSSSYPGYSPVETERKANATGGPRTCGWYRTESGNGSVCEGCSHRVTSPIILGREVVEGSQVFAEAIQPVSARPAAPTAEALSSLFGGEESTQEEADVELPEDSLPEIPFPYVRDVEGRIWRKAKGADGEDESRLISSDPLYVVKRVVDPNDGVCAVLRLHPPHDAVMEFSVPLKDLQVIDKFRDVMSAKGVVANKREMEELMTYTTAFVKSLRSKMKADEARSQFGWADRDTKFILGTREIRAKDVGYSPASSATQKLAGFLEPVGDMDAWRKAFNMYVGVPNSEAQQFALMSAFGSPLMKIIGMSGVLISLVNTTSGTGKTSVLRLINSVWGHPDELMQLQKDTVLAKQHRMGVMGCLPSCFDEITNSKPDELSDMVYGISHGRGRNRMRADANNERVNETRWNSISVASGNASVMDKLAANKSTSDGELMRVMEYKVSLAEVKGAAAMLHDLSRNYGHAGGVYAQALVKHRTELTGWLDKMRNRIIKDANVHAKERFWSNTITCNLVGGYIAQRLGLHDYDMKAIEEWLVGNIDNQRNVVRNHIVGATDLIGEYLLENFGSTLVVNALMVNPVTGTNVFKHANGRIAARFEIDTNTLLIPKRELKEYCVRRQGDLEKALHTKNADYVYRAVSKRRLTTGTGMIAPPVEAFEFSLFGDLAKQLVGEPEDVAVGL